jgi:hypothetical protein
MAAEVIEQDLRLAMSLTPDRPSCDVWEYWFTTYQGKEALSCIVSSTR